MTRTPEQLLKELVFTLRQMEEETAIELTWPEAYRAEQWYLEQGFAYWTGPSCKVTVQCTCPQCSLEHRQWHCNRTSDPFEDVGWRVQLVHTAYASLWPVTPLDAPDGLEVRDLTETFVGVLYESKDSLVLAGLCPACLAAGTLQPWDQAS